MLLVFPFLEQLIEERAIPRDGVGQVVLGVGNAELVGHTSPTGPLALNDQLSLARAEKVWQDLARQSIEVSDRVTTRGVGSSEAIIGTGRDDYSDMLDRRVEFRPMDCQSQA